MTWKNQLSHLKGKGKINTRKDGSRPTMRTLPEFAKVLWVAQTCKNKLSGV